ncbi:MAG: hypothetical protein RL344_1120 [Pseudomonadota bacterium]|jgi:competence protein ComEC
MSVNKTSLYFACPIAVLGFVLGCLSIQFTSTLPAAEFVLPYLIVTSLLTLAVWAITIIFYGVPAKPIIFEISTSEISTSEISASEISDSKLSAYKLIIYKLSVHKILILLIFNFFIAGLFGIVWATYDGSQRVANGFPTELEGKNVTATGYVSHLPKVSSQSQQVLFVIERSDADNHINPAFNLKGKTIALSWYQPKFNLQAAQQYRLTFRAKQRHGTLNPNGFDYERWLVSNSIAATGYIRTVDEDLNTQVQQFLPWVERIRSIIRTQVFLISPNQDAARWVAALALGDQRSLDDTQWQRYNNTGTGHLLAVSGTHIALMGALLAWLGSHFWRANPKRLLWIPLQTIRLNILLWSSIIYALIAGWALPAQRTVFMLCVAFLAKKIMAHPSVYHVMAIAAAMALMQEPIAVISPSFWLSYGAVAVLVAVEWRHKNEGISEPQLQTTTEFLTQWHHYKLIIKTAAHTQWVLTLVLIPLTALFFNQTSLVSPLANAVAIPIMGWISTPVALLAAVLSGVWQPAAVLLMRILLFVQTMMEWILEALLRIPYASIHIPSTPWFWQIFGVLAAISCAFLTRRRILGYIAVALFILGSICFTVYLSWDKSAWRIVFLDVGQGMAVVIHSQGRTLLFDTGPRYGSESDGAERVILPYLYSVGVHSLDHVILSHADEDHSGGVSSLVTQMPIKQWWYSLAPQHRLLTLLPSNRLPCQAGKQLLWAGLRIQFLHPPTVMTPLDFLNRSTNSVSCVLKISSVNGTKQHSVLLTGDIESAQELNLVNEYSQMLQSTILLSPHHGSKTSSRTEFLSAVNPSHVVIQNGYRNRYGHPHPLVSQRYTEAGIKQWRSDVDGAVVVDIHSEADEPIKIQAWRTVAKRYWHTVMPSIN